MKPHLGVELHACTTVHVQVARKRTSPARERKHGQRHWDGHIDANHANINLHTQSAHVACKMLGDIHCS